MFTLTKEKLIPDLYSAFYCAKKSKSGKSYVKKFEENLDFEINKLAEDLLSSSYTPEPSSCFIIEKPKKREVFAAQFRDRVVHHLYFNYTHKLYERTFIDDSYSCITGRGTHYGIERLKKHILSESKNYTHPCYVIKFDIRGYFMNINRQFLLNIASNTLKTMSTHRISKKSNETWDDILDFKFLLNLTRNIVLLDPTKNCTIIGGYSDWKGLDYNKSLFNTPPGCGLPIGNLTSQLLSNVYLNIFDQFMKRELKCKHYGRYVDDSYVVSCDKKWLLSLVPKVQEFLKLYLGLELNMGKLIITDVKYGVEFLGAYIKPYRTYISNKSLKRMINSVNDLDLKDHDGTFRSVNSFLGVLSHYSSWNIRNNLFLTPQMLSVSSFNRNITKMKKPPQ